MMCVLVPEVVLPEGLDLGNPLTTPREWVANPKAVAAQPFAKPDIHAAYHASGCWQDIAPMFTVNPKVSGAVSCGMRPSVGLMP